MLHFNGLHEETGGVRFGLTHPYGDIVMHFETPLGDLTLERLKTVIFNFADTIIEWREFLQSNPGEVDPPLAIPEPSITRV